MRVTGRRCGGGHAPQSARPGIGQALSVWLAGALCLVLLCHVAAVRECLAAGVPDAVWQDNDRNHRRSPSQIKRQLRSPDVRAARLPLAAADRVGSEAAPPGGEADHSARQARVRAQIAQTAAPPASSGDLQLLGENDWRLKIESAAVALNDSVFLGDIATPLGHMDPALWQELSRRALWAAPQQEGKPMQVNRSRLSQALRQALGKDIAGRCILPTSLVIQRGGLVFREDVLRDYVVKSLTPQLAAMPGEAQLTEFRLPEYIFLEHGQQQVQLEPGKLAPGRIALRFAVKEADGTVLRRLAGTVNLQLWVTVPAATRVMSKGENLTPEAVTFLRINAATLKDLPWDGQGGPWRLARGLAAGEPILQSDLQSQLMVRRGDVVTLIYARGNVQMTTQAEALSDGEPGATIAVRNLQSKKQVYAKVKDGGTVIIE
ncbi:MAG TPA: flagellar basal body P-ring formation chaperone FlgA [Candidatus Desulfovibrio intestinavium]|uniref:Flagellar basal body P-ring formation chaperone FlgA n=1 Tax=Candidatus Desulfovibrio intestinavium TaxID=2838534 RepID=A0A9D2KQT8_9BACT|nr:flagellar basal body P-ring formation chaperone FlgA [Candidatus Desulfovibrio intestinavium]